MLTHYDEFSGIGGFSDAARFVPGVRVDRAANHDPEACQEHERNFPDAVHYQEDVTKLDLTKMPRVDLFSGSPACPAWTGANGVKRDFDQANAVRAAIEALEDEQGRAVHPKSKEARKRAKQYQRSRLLMHEPVLYLRACLERDPHNPVLIGVIENVIQCRQWAEWAEWIGEFHKMGYRTRLIALNAMHARPRRAPRAPQSRDRLFLAFWHISLGRDPDWDKWLRPKAFCPKCQTVVDAVQWFKKRGADMGRYLSQYLYVCPNKSCDSSDGKPQQVFPEVAPALTAIDLGQPGTRIGDREKLGKQPLADATMARIKAGIRRHWEPLLVPAGGSWQGKGAQGARPVSRPAAALTTRESQALAVPPLLVPLEARAQETRVHSAGEPFRTMTTRAETAIAMPPPFLASLRGGGSKLATRPISDPATTVTANGNHHALVAPPGFLMRNNSVAGDPGYLSTLLAEPARSLTTAGHQSLVTAGPALVPYYDAADGTPGGWLAELPDIDDVMFRMLSPQEIGRLMGFGAHFRNEASSKRSQVRLYGNAVCPAAGEVIIAALVECARGEDLEREITSSAGWDLVTA